MATPNPAHNSKSDGSLESLRTAAAVSWERGSASRVIAAVDGFAQERTVFRIVLPESPASLTRQTTSLSYFRHSHARSGTPGSSSLLTPIPPPGPYLRIFYPIHIIDYHSQSDPPPSMLYGHALKVPADLLERIGGCCDLSPLYV